MDQSGQARKGGDQVGNQRILMQITATWIVAKQCDWDRKKNAYSIEE